MQNNSYNKEHFFFSISNQAMQFSVIEIEGQNDALSSDYHFIIKATTPSYLDPLTIIGTAAQLYWDNFQQPSGKMNNHDPNCSYNRRHGIISHLLLNTLHSDESVNTYQYIFTLHSPLYPLRLQFHNRIFQKKNVIEIIQEALNATAWSKTTYRFAINNLYPPLEYITQFRQSDYDFIESLLIQNGLFYSFEQYEHHAQWVIYDAISDISTASPVTIDFQSPTELLANNPTFLQWQEQTQFLTNQIILTDNYYMTPDLNLTVTTKNQSNLQGTGCISLCDNHYLNFDRGQKYATIMQQQLDWQRQIFSAKSNHPHLKSGQLITLNHHDNQAWNKSYRILSIQHQYKSVAVEIENHDANLKHPNDALGPIAYYNFLKLIPATANFCVPNAWCDANCHSPASFRNTLINFMPSTITSDIISPYAAVDEYGRYTVQLPFAENSLRQFPSSLPIRFLQYTGGNSDQGFQYGWHFPLHVDTPVAVTFINGDINRPVIIGVLPYGHAPNPVNINNNTQNLWQTYGGQTCLFEEKHGHAKIQLSTRQQHNRITLDATDNHHQININSAHGLLSIYAQQDISIQAGDTIKTQSAGDHQITVAQKQQLTTKNSDIQMQSGNNLLLTAQQNLTLQSKQGNISLNSADQFTVQTNESFNLSTQGDIDLLIQHGHFYGISPEGIKIACQGNGSILLQQGTSLLNLTEKGNVMITANTIKCTAPNIIIKKT